MLNDIFIVNHPDLNIIPQQDIVMYAYGAYPQRVRDEQFVSPTAQLAQRYNRALSNPNALVSTAAYNPNLLIASRSLARANAAQFGYGLGGSPFLPPTYGAGSYRNSLAFNTADNSVGNAYNLDREGINTDYRRFRPGYYSQGTEAYSNPNPSAIHPAYYPYQPYGTGSYSPSYGYQRQAPGPAFSPECRGASVCSLAHPGDPNGCRSCVIGQGNSAHCADQVCGPYQY